MYQQWEHEAVRTSRSLMTALSPAGDHKTQCNKLGRPSSWNRAAVLLSDHNMRCAVAWLLCPRPVL